MFEPIKVGFGEYMVGFYGSLTPTTKAMPEFIARGAVKSLAYAPSRMVDAVEEMLAAWQRNDTDTADTKPAKLPVIIVAMAQDYMPTGRDFTRQIAEPMEVIIPGDVKERAFGLRTVAGDIRAQIAIVAADEPTAKSIASQFSLFLDAVPNRRFHYSHTFAGAITQWPVQIEAPDVPAIAVKTGLKNVVILAIDLTLKAQIPLYDAPKAGEYNDGKGVPGTDDPAGYPLVAQVNTIGHDAP
ncbi:MAG: hypothetical protein ACXWT0_00180 [Methylobacter sp.]